MDNAKWVVCCHTCPYKHPQEPNTCGFRADSIRYEYTECVMNRLTEL